MGVRRLAAGVAAMVFAAAIGTATATGLAATAAASDGQLPGLDRLGYLTQDRDQAHRKALSDPIGYAWDLFYYVSWPAEPGAQGRGQPDPDKRVGDPGGPTLWQSWMGEEEVYLADGETPPAWAPAYPQPPGDVPRLPPASTGSFWTPLTGNAQADGFDLKGPDGQPILYHMRLSPDAFGYVRDNALYSADGQIAFAQANPDGAQFPWTAMEAKGAWRVLDPQADRDQIGKYFTSHAYYAVRNDDGSIKAWNKVLVGLTGLHLTTKAIDRWVWATWEQVDNPAWTGVHRVTPIPDQVKASSQKAQALLAGTPWQYYELVGVQVDWGTKAASTLLANTQIESHFQSRSSCMSCHGRAGVKAAKPTTDKPLRPSYLDPTGGSPPYYIGPIPDLPDGYVPLDFVFSLYSAQFEK